MFQFLFRLLFPLPCSPPLLLPSADCTDSIRTKGRCSLEWSGNSSVSPHSHSWCLLVCMINFINFPDLLCHWNKYDSCCAVSVLPLAKWDAEMCFLVDCRLGQISSKQTKQDSSWSYWQSRCGIKYSCFSRCKSEKADFPSSRFPRYSFKKTTSCSTSLSLLYPPVLIFFLFRVNYLIAVNTKMLSLWLPLIFICPEKWGDKEHVKVFCKL